MYRAGTRASRLALIQTREALRQFESRLTGVAFELVPCSSPGDRDLATDLRTSPGDFFTRDLDDAVREGRLDLAIHSAKDLPDPLPEGLDWCWLPWREDPRDALVLAPGRTVAALPAAPVIGISSDRRAGWCRARFPGAELRPIRGNIDERLAQLDAGAYDAILMAGAALARLGLAERVSEWIPLDALAVPDGQGVLALTFRAGDPPLVALRNALVKAVRFVGAGVGSADLCTLAGAAELAAAEVCLYDVLMDERLLERLPPTAQRLFVGKRAGAHAQPQAEINRLLADYARRGLRVVRLKGGDPGLFGRLAEELAELERWQLPYRVLPGVSSLTAATTATGLLLTRRGVSRGFTVMTPRAEGGALAPVGAAARARLPLVLFMGVQVAGEAARQLLEEGWEAETPVAVVFDAGGENERITRLTLGALAAGGAGAAEDDAPGLVIVGEVTRYGVPAHAGALEGRRVLLTCSTALQERAARRVVDYGGRPLGRPLIRLEPTPEARRQIRKLDAYRAAMLTSPSAVRCFLEVVAAERVDLRQVPRLIACGPGTAAELRKAGLLADVVPADDFGAAGLRQALGAFVRPGDRVLRLRSDKAGDELARAVQAMGADVTDCVLYTNAAVPYETLPAFDAVFFASASAVEVFVAAWGVAALEGKTVLVIGRPTAAALELAGRAPDVHGFEATVDGAIEALAWHTVRGRLGG